MLGRLHRASLIQPAGPGRYGLHDLLRAYARELAAARDTDGTRAQQALTRLFDYYLAAALPPRWDNRPVPRPKAHRRPRIPAAAASSCPAVYARRGRRAGVAGYRGTGQPGRGRREGTLRRPRLAPGTPPSSAATLFRYLMTGSHLPEARTIYGHTLQAARRSGDVTAEAEALNGLGGIGMMKGHFRDSGRYYEAALELYRQCGDRASEARVLRNLGVTERQLHNYRSAADYYGQAIAAYDDVGDGVTRARAVADLCRRRDRDWASYDQATTHLRRALQVLREAEDQLGEARALSWFGELSVRRGELAQAAVFFEQSLMIFRRVD